MAEGTRIDKIYYRISSGYLWRRAMVGDPPQHIATRTTKKGNKVDEMKFSHISGFVQDIHYMTNEWQGETSHMVQITLMDEDGSQYRAIKANMEYGPGQSILSRFPNIVIELPVTIHVAQDGNERTFLWITQGGETVPMKYTKETPHDQPQWVVTPLPNGKNHYDRSAQLQWYINKISSWKSMVSFAKVTV